MIRLRFLGVIEQRVTNTVVFIMIGLSVFLYDFLKVARIKFFKLKLNNLIIIILS